MFCGYSDSARPCGCVSISSGLNLSRVQCLRCACSCSLATRPASCYLRRCVRGGKTGYAGPPGCRWIYERNKWNVNKIVLALRGPWHRRCCTGAPRFPYKTYFIYGFLAICRIIVTERASVNHGEVSTSAEDKRRQFTILRNHQRSKKTQFNITGQLRSQNLYSCIGL